MAHFLRVIRRGRWYEHPSLAWLPSGELQADALTDLRTEANTLSIFRVGTEREAERIATALAAKRDSLAVFDYAIFDDEHFAECGLEQRHVRGKTPDDVVNDLHYDLFNLTVTNLVDLARFVQSGDKFRIHKKKIQTLLEDGLTSSSIDRARCSKTLLSKF